MKDPAEAKIIDLGEATALSTIGFQLVRLEQSNTGRHKIFVFDSMHPHTSTVTVDDIIDCYNRRKLAVDAWSYYRAEKELKNKIHEHDEINGTPR